MREDEHRACSRGTKTVADYLLKCANCFIVKKSTNKCETTWVKAFINVINIFPVWEIDIKLYFPQACCSAAVSARHLSHCRHEVKPCTDLRQRASPL